MFSSNVCILSPSQPVLSHSLNSISRWRLNSPMLAIVIVSGPFRPRGRSRRRHNKLTISAKPSLQPKLETVIDFNHLSTQTSSTLRTIFPSFESNIREFISLGKEAYRDIQTLVTFTDSHRVVVSCRPSTLQFVGTSVLITLVMIFVYRVLIKLVTGFWPWGRNASGFRPLVRRDRSLGGKEVIVGWNSGERSNAKYNFSVSANTLSPTQGSVMGISKRVGKNKFQVQAKLPKWWPTLVKHAVSTDEQEEYKREAYRVVRAIMDSRMSGQDIMENNIIQLRQICRTSGVQVFIDPTNIRDSLYRASVDFVMKVCCRAPSYSTSIEINREDARNFLAGFAENIALENVRAATIVSAAVAARTRSCLLQAWALEMQGKHVETKVELSKICLLLQIFPPEESSPEMEMVARGLEKHLKLEQRKYLMDVFAKVCGEDSHRIAREALGLMQSQHCGGDQHRDKIM